MNFLEAKFRPSFCSRLALMAVLFSNVGFAGELQLPETVDLSLVPLQSGYHQLHCNIPGVMIQLDDSGNFDLHIYHADFSSIDPTLVGSLTITADSVVGSKLSSVSCMGNSCSIFRTPQ